MIFINLLIVIINLEVFPLIYRKILTSFGTMVSYLNWKKCISGNLRKSFDEHFYETNRIKLNG